MDENMDLFEKINNILQKHGLLLNKAKNCAIKNQHNEKLFLGDDFYVLWKKPFNNEKHGSSEEIRGDLNEKNMLCAKSRAINTY